MYREKKKKHEPVEAGFFFNLKNVLSIFLAILFDEHNTRRMLLG